MTDNTYKATSEYGRAIFGEDVFDADFTSGEERDHLGAHLEIVPRKYKILSDNFSGGPQGGEYRAALLKDVESALIQGGHLQRDDTPDKKPAEKKTATK